jgi:hypothetical protein
MGHKIESKVVGYVRRGWRTEAVMERVEHRQPFLLRKPEKTEDAGQ